MQARYLVLVYRTVERHTAKLLRVNSPIYENNTRWNGWYLPGDIVNVASIPIVFYQIAPEGHPNANRMAGIEQPEQGEEHRRVFGKHWLYHTNKACMA